MPAPKLRPVAAEHHDPAAGHVLAAVVADAFDDGDGAGVAHGEALADHAADERLPAGGAVQDDVAGDDLLLGHEAGGPDGEGRTTSRPPDRPLPR